MQSRKASCYPDEVRGLTYWVCEDRIGLHEVDQLGDQRRQEETAPSALCGVGLDGTTPAPAAAAVPTNSGIAATASRAAAAAAPLSTFRLRVKSLYASKLAGVTCTTTTAVLVHRRRFACVFGAVATSSRTGWHDRTTLSSIASWPA